VFSSVLGLAVLIAFGVLQMRAPTLAYADTAPPEGTAVTAAADPLPTTQIDGVVWTQVIVGNTVYAGGNFTKARPAGVAPGGVGEVARSNLLAYNLTTGELDPSFAPALNGQVKELALSPDKSILYVAGQFTTINGVNRYRVAAFSTATGALLPFQPNINSTVNGITVTSSLIYIVGIFTTVGGQLRDGVAAILPTTGAVTAFNPILGGGDAQAIVVSPDGTKVVLGGNFTTVNGSGSPGYGLAMVDAATSASLPTPVNSVVRNGGSTAGITELVARSDGFYGSGYTYSRNGGNLEGMFRADWNGNLVFMEDCHGDTYSIYPSTDAVYTAGHPHYCGNSGGFLQPTTWVYWRGMAWSNSVGGVITRENLGYYNFEGQPRPELLDFFPYFKEGDFTGQSQGPWEVTGNDDYVLYGGEFTLVNSTAQQGLVRFARPNVAAPKLKPELDYNNYKLTFTPMASGQLRVGWPATWDRDNERLSYRLVRDGVKVFETQAVSRFWSLPQMSYMDTGLTPGQSHVYSLRVSDPHGNLVWNAPVTYTYQTGPAFNSYDNLVLADNPRSYWRLNEASGAVATDVASGWNANKAALVTVGANGAISGSADTAYSFNPTTTSTTSTVIPQTTQLASNTFSVEAWFKTTSTRGGALLNFGNAISGNSSTSTMDRVVYLSNAGRVYFGVSPGQVRTINSTTSYNNGQWHHVAATLGADGMKLYIDGQLAASNANWTVGKNYVGVWRIGGDRMSGWTSNPSNSYLSATIDQVALYPVVLSSAQINSHFVLGSTGQMPNRPPVASISTTVDNLSVNADSVGSSDPDGTIATYTWNFGDGTPLVTTPTASHTYAAGGTYTVTLTVTDNQGATGTASQQVSVLPANVLPVASFTKTITDLGVALDAGGSSDPDGTIASYAWDFGDGTTGTGATTNHAYTAGGTYNVVLTVTDNRGGVATANQSVTVIPANVLPTAAFSWSAVALTLSFDGSGSSDSDGTISGYAWDFGDGTTGTGSTVDHTYAAAGDYAAKLTVTDNRGGTATVTKTVTATATVNAKPVASFTSSATGLKAQFDGSGSSDSDGSVASYAWDFGDSTTGTGVTPTHTYSADGTYTVSLVVTDDVGATSTATTKQVTVSNAKPTAAFSTSVSGLVASVDAADSSDPDGTIAGYAWDFGDGSTGTGTSPNHTYSGTGTYTVKLTVTDDKGSTDSVTHVITLGSGAIVADKFGRTATRWGDADTGGTWTYANASYYSISDSVGQVRLPSAGASGTASLTSVSARDVNVFAQISQDTALTGTGTYNTFIVRRTGTSDYRMTVRISGDGSVRLNITKRVNGVSTNLGDVVVSGVAYSPGDVLNVRFVANGNGTTSLEAKAWKQGTAEPATAQMRKSDSAAELQGPGDFGVTSYLGGTVTTVPVLVRLDNLLVTPA
jgi:PKD repeat protein